jgi:hypothetical protein
MSARLSGDVSPLPMMVQFVSGNQLPSVKPTNFRGMRRAQRFSPSSVRAKRWSSRVINCSIKVGVCSLFAICSLVPGVLKHGNGKFSSPRASLITLEISSQLRCRGKICLHLHNYSIKSHEKLASRRLQTFPLVGGRGA